MVPFVVSSTYCKNSVVVSNKLNSSVVLEISTESFFGVKFVLVTKLSVVDNILANVLVSLYISTLLSSSEMGNMNEVDLSEKKTLI